MRITDKEALREIRIVKCTELEESIDEYPEAERDGRSDMQFLADEVSYFLNLYTEGGTAHSDDLEWCKEVLRKTKNGKVMPLWSGTLKPMYRKSDIQNARDCINEYKRLQSCMKRINAKGFYGKW